jgi:hypothetical protein
MKNAEKDKLDQALAILEDVDLGLSWVWMWTWGTIKYFMQDPDYRFLIPEDEVWDALVMATATDSEEFTLQYGTETHYDIVKHWLTENNIMFELLEEDPD